MKIQMWQEDIFWNSFVVTLVCQNWVCAIIVFEYISIRYLFHSLFSLAYTKHIIIFKYINQYLMIKSIQRSYWGGSTSQWWRTWRRTPPSSSCPRRWRRWAPRPTGDPGPGSHCWAGWWADRGELFAVHISQFSVLKSEFWVLSSQFWVLSSQKFWVLSSQF